MEYNFWKYQGTGNDFIFLDGRTDVTAIKGNKEVISNLCDRKFGIGADGLIIIEKEVGCDFRMVYYNADGGETSMCGNGGRCSIAFAKWKGFSDNETEFVAIDGKHVGKIAGDGWVDLGMIDVNSVEKLNDKVFIMNTGSPHYVYFANNSEDIDIYEFGRNIRYNETYKSAGINVNVVRIETDGISVETYERGVEDETLSCGTGVTACAIAYSIYKKDLDINSVNIKTKGGNLAVSFEFDGNKYTDIVLSGPVKRVFSGSFEL